MLWAACCPGFFASGRCICAFKHFRQAVNNSKLIHSEKVLKHISVPGDSIGELHLGNELWRSVSFFRRPTPEIRGRPDSMRLRIGAAAGESEAVWLLGGVKGFPLH